MRIYLSGLAGLWLSAWWTDASMLWSAAQGLTTILLFPAAFLLGMALNVGWHVVFPDEDKA